MYCRMGQNPHNAYKKICSGLVLPQAKVNILGIIFAQGPEDTWWVMQDQETWYVPQGDLILWWDESVMLNCIILVAEWHWQCMPELPWTMLQQSWAPDVDCNPNSTPALLPWKTSRMHRIHNYGLNELNRQLGGMGLDYRNYTCACIYVYSWNG